MLCGGIEKHQKADDIELDFCEKLGHVAFVSSRSMKCPHVCTGLFYGAASMGNILRTPTS